MKKLLFGKAEVEIDVDLVAKKREEIVAVRGKKVRDVGEKEGGEEWRVCLSPDC